MECIIVVLVQELAHARSVAKIAQEMLAPARSALVNEGGVEGVGALVDPLPKGVAAPLCERRLEAPSVLEDDDVPAHVTKKRIDLQGEAVLHHAVQALPVVVDHPPHIADVVLPALEESLKDVSLVQFRIPHEGHHAPW